MRLFLKVEWNDNVFPFEFTIFLLFFWIFIRGVFIIIILLFIIAVWINNYDVQDISSIQFAIVCNDLKSIQNISHLHYVSIKLKNNISLPNIVSTIYLISLRLLRNIKLFHRVECLVRGNIKGIKKLGITSFLGKEGKKIPY